jgi:hypothetical protein
MVEVRDHENVVMETGDAEQTSEWEWSYLITKTIDKMNRLTIIVYAWDKPGNMVSDKIIVV